MHTNVALIAFLLQSIATPCLARSSRRSASLNALDLSSLLNITFSDPTLPIATLPYEVPLNDGHNTKLRIVSYTPPHIQSFNLLPCIVEMMSTAFTKVSDNDDPHPRLLEDRYTCSTDNSFGIQISGTQVTAPLEYSDLISLARMLVMFQQNYTMPGLTFEYWFKGQMLGEGNAWMQFAGRGNRTGGLSLS